MDDLSTTALHQTLLPGVPVVVSESQQFNFDGDVMPILIISGIANELATFTRIG